ncbi:AhpC/TSA family protein [Paenibacillus psychroresistens]|uniref:AhpC/TSA family protein n=1 Tax=Paenibacillus psychroresistens TaxID=1778678 RepID=A0A6B8RWY5_9BACL|nr:peroxiredoxin-like family protein [Paenibacillus psychroresistens]QGQ99578.1 AhpC/TSA family protein [Paenibacillus psychroresistens]
MKIQSGMTAPNFEVEDMFGKQVSLQSYTERKVLLAFFRNSACAMCNLRVHQLIQQYAEWSQKGFEIIAVFESPLENMAPYVGQREAPFPIISDPHAKLYELYGVETSAEKIQKMLTNPETGQMIIHAAEQGFPLIKEEGSNFNRLPAEFLIGPQLRIQQAFYSDVVYEHLPLETIAQFAASSV